MEKKLEVLKKGLEMGAWIRLSVHGDRSKEEAEVIMKELSEIANLNYEDRNGENDCFWFQSNNYKFDVAVHYRETKEDKIRLLEQQLAALKEETA